MNLRLLGAASGLPVVLGLGTALLKPPSSTTGSDASIGAAAVITRGSVLRSGPSSSSTSLGRLEKGAVVSVLESSSGYVEIETEGDEVGWVSGRNLHFVDGATPPGGDSTAGRLGPTDIYPDLTRTPGATNPDITQDNIAKTICNPDRSQWSTKMIRPPTSYTTPLKTRQIREYGYTDQTLRDYEEDHLISLELGGNPRDPRNLWPEPYRASIADGGARYKDKVENYLHDQVCAGKLTLEEAQRAIVQDWYQVYSEAIAGRRGP